MSKARKYRKLFPCGHQAYGQICHRCETAEKLEKYADYKNRKFKTFKKKENPNPPKIWTRDELLAEARRLREDGRKYT